MLKEFLRSTIPPLKALRVRGQALVFFALLIPLLFLFAGVGLDLGWYYLNVSRLQNAADAAALAGAQIIINDEVNFPTVTNEAVLISNRSFDNDRKYTGRTDGEKATLENADDIAEEYAVKNLGSMKDIVLGEAEAAETQSSIIDSWSKSKKDSERVVTPTYSLYDYGTNFYYVVKLEETIEHFFLPGWFSPMDAPVVAVALLTRTTPTIPRDPGKGSEQELPDGTDILTEMYKLEDKYVVRNWEWEKNATAAQYEAFMHKKKYNEPRSWTEYQEEKKKVYYTNGNHYRTEPIYVYDGSKSTSSAVHSSAANVASLNVDFNPDIDYKLTDDSKDWDIGYTFPEGLKQTDRSSGKDPRTNGQDFRIHANIDFEAPFAVRTNNTYNATDNPEDALYVRIESEPFNPLSFKPSHTYYSTVRQIFININQSNMNEQYRPLVIFYDGPEQMTANSTVRDSQPVVLTLNADARVILFAPNSPVVIRGNNHKMQGFVIAREFVQLTTASDYTKEGDKYYKDGNEYFLKEDGHGNKMFIDEYGNVQTKPLDANSVRDPDYIAKLKTDTNYSDYATQLKREKYYLELKADTNYADCSEMPENTGNITDLNFEKVYDMKKAFKLSDTSYYDSFKLPTLKRNVYTYLDNYTNSDKENAIDMFFTKYRASWID